MSQPVVRDRRSTLDDIDKAFLSLNKERSLIQFRVISFLLQLNTEWAQVEVINLINDGSGLGFGIIGGRSTGVVVKTILPGGVADRVSKSNTGISRPIKKLDLREMALHTCNTSNDFANVPLMER